MTSFFRIASIALGLGVAAAGLGGCATAGPTPDGVDLAQTAAPSCWGCTPVDGFAQFGWDDGYYGWPYAYSYVGWPHRGAYHGWWHSHFHGHASGRHR